MQQYINTVNEEYYRKTNQLEILISNGFVKNGELGANKSLK